MTNTDCILTYRGIWPKMVHLRKRLTLEVRRFQLEIGPKYAVTDGCDSLQHHNRLILSSKIKSTSVLPICCHNRAGDCELQCDCVEHLCSVSNWVLQLVFHSENSRDWTCLFQGIDWALHRRSQLDSRILILLQLVALAEWLYWWSSLFSLLS